MRINPLSTTRARIYNNTINSNVVTRYVRVTEDAGGSMKTDMVHKTVVSPVRQLSGLMKGVSTGLEFFLSSKRRRRGAGVPQDEMFI